MTLGTVPLFDIPASVADREAEPLDPPRRLAAIPARPRVGQTRQLVLTDAPRPHGRLSL